MRINSSSHVTYYHFFFSYAFISFFFAISWFKLCFGRTQFSKSGLSPPTGAEEQDNLNIKNAKLEFNVDDLKSQHRKDKILAPN